jgi:PAS domain S-box-containing protein
MLPGYVCLLTPDHGFAYVNDSYRRILGDPAGRKCYQARFGREEPCPWCESFRCLETGEPHTWEWTSPSGASFQVYLHPFVDIDGSTLVLELGIDVSEQKRQRVALEQTTAMLETLVETMPSGVIVADAEGRITIVNEHMRRILGGPIGPVVGEVGAGYTIRHQDSTPFAPVDLPLVRALRLGESARNVEMTFRRADGSEVPTVLAASPLRDRDGKPAGAVAIVRDITELHRARLELLRHRDRLEALVDERTAELAQRSLNLRSLAAELALTEERQRHRIAAGIHDEISQTLAFSKLQLEELRAAAVSEEQAAALADIVGMLARILQYTRDLTFEISPPILYQVGFDAAIEWLGERMTKHHGYAVTVTADEEAREISEDARIVLFQGVREILTNVAKHARASEVTIDIGRDGDEMRVVLQDNGVGFDASKPMVGGVTGGFGLFDISERLAHLGGHLAISSTPGLGSTFTLTAPLLSD